MSGRRMPLVGSYRGRLVLGYAVVVVLFCIAWAWSLFGPITNAVVGQQAAELVAIARTGSALASQGQGAAEIAQTLSDASGVRVTVVAGSGVVLADSSETTSTMENHAGRPEVAAALAGRTGEARRVSRTEGTEQLYVAVPARIDGRTGAVRASQRLTDIGHIAAQARRFGLVLLLIALTLAATIATVVSRSLAEPVASLAAAAERIASGDLGAEIPRPTGELGALADALRDVRLQIRTRIDDLEAGQQSLRSALDGLADAVFLLEGGAIEFANSAASAMFRPPLDGWRGHGIREAGLPAALAARMSEPSEGASGSEGTLSDPTGRALRFTIARLDPAEGHERSLVVVSDVTERAHLDRVRRDFVANASHELKTPVAGIQLLAESAATAAFDGDDAQAVAFAKQIEEESSRLQRLVGDLLDLSRLESTPSAESMTNVREGIANAIVGHRFAAESRGLYLRLDDSTDADQDVWAAADPTDLAVALDNLIDNAVAYTESGGVTIRVTASSGVVRVSVTDTGIGIPAADLPRIFERFYRVDRARSRESGGTGLGLALVRHAAERSGGSVTVESVEGTGSTFTLTFARAR